MKDCINMQGGPLRLDSPLVMAILNVTPDSFSDTCHLMDVNDVTAAAACALSEGAHIIDIGGCSMRPGGSPVDEEEELRRVKLGVTAVHTAFPKAIISVDTFRSRVAEVAVNECGADIINDISGGLADPDMFATVARLQVPYILTHTRVPDPLPSAEGSAPDYLSASSPMSAPLHVPFFDGQLAEQVPSTGDLLEDMIAFFRLRIAQLHARGVQDIIIDPGYCFGKSLPQNYEVLRRQSELLALDCPILAGLSHKSMIYKPLDIAPAEAVNGTSVLNTMALIGGASILRVHDVKEAIQTINLYKLCQA